MVEFRQAGLSDAEILTQMRLLMLCDGTDYPEEFKSMIKINTLQFIEHGFADQSFVSWVALDGVHIVSMGGINFFSLPPNDWCPNGKTAYIGNMYTRPHYRRQGIATCILSHIVDEAKSRDCQRILLNTTNMGRTLYGKFGFDLSPTAMALYPFGIIPFASFLFPS